MDKVENVSFLNMVMSSNEFKDVLFSKKSIKKLLYLNTEEEVDEHIDTTIKGLNEVGIPIQQFFIKGKNNEDFFNSAFLKFIIIISVRKDVIETITKGKGKCNGSEEILDMLKKLF